MNKIKVADIEYTFKELFNEEDGLIKSYDIVYEKPKNNNNEDYLKLIISIHGLYTEETTIIHTKFIFKTDINKRYLIENSFLYLYDINCVYHRIDFKNNVDLKNKIKNIIENNNFGQDIQILSDFIESPAMFLNYYLKRSKITNYSVFGVEYEPKFKTVPCEQISFDFKINVNNIYFINLSIHKIDKKNESENDVYRFQFRFIDEIETVETDSLKNIHYFIGSNMAKMLNKKLKTK